MRSHSKSYKAKDQIFRIISYFIRSKRSIKQINSNEKYAEKHRPLDNCVTLRENVQPGQASGRVWSHNHVAMKFSGICLRMLEDPEAT